MNADEWIGALGHRPVAIPAWDDDTSTADLRDYLAHDAFARAVVADQHARMGRHMIRFGPTGGW